jgi:ABC-type uncharacterized transport system substrate-binding protein
MTPPWATGGADDLLPSTARIHRRRCGWARAQQRAMPVVGWLSTRNSETDAHVLPAFRRGLNRQGYIEGRNLIIEYRWSDTQDDRLPALAVDLVRRQVAVIVAVGTTRSAVRAVQAITTTIPIISAAVAGDAVFRRPGGNEAAEQLAIPAIYFRREFALAGGLMSYGTNADENLHVMGEYTGRILKGEKLAICLFNNRPGSSL